MLLFINLKRITLPWLAYLFNVGSTVERTSVERSVKFADDSIERERNCCLTSTEASRPIRDGDEWERGTEE